MQVITFYSYKGGVGRTLALTNIARRLANDYGKTIAIVDFDLEAPGLHYKFQQGLKKPISKGLVDYIFKYAVNGIIEEKIEPFCSTIIPEHNNAKPIYLIPAGNTSSNDYWKKLAAINWHDIFYKPNSRGVEFILNLKKQIQNELNPDFLLIDSRTGITEISGITMSLLADDCIILSVNNEENISGSKQVINALRNPDNIHKKKINIHFVLTRIPYSQNPDIRGREIKLIDSFKKKLDLSIIHVLHSDPTLEWEEIIKIGGIAKEDEVPIGQEYLNLFEAIIHPHLNEQDFDRFNNIKKIENLLALAFSTDDNYEKIELFSEILEIDANNSDAIIGRAKLYFKIKRYTDALEDFKKAGNKYKKEQADCLIKLKEYDNALLIINNLLDKQEKNEWLYKQKYKLLENTGASQEEINFFFNNWENNTEKNADFFNTRSNWFFEQKLFDKALEDASKAISIDVKYAVAYATLAEIHAALDNEEAFFLNIELAFIFGLRDYISSDSLTIPTHIYQKYISDERFSNLLKQYNVEAEFYQIYKFNKVSI